MRTGPGRAQALPSPEDVLKNVGLIVGVAGGSGAGKTTAVRLMRGALAALSTTSVSADWYYRRPPGDPATANYDHPEALDLDLLAEHLDELRSGSAVPAPRYSFTEHRRLEAKQTIHPADVVFVDGILVLALPRLLQRLDIGVFVDASPDTRLIRRLRRDVRERRRTWESVINQWEATVRPMHVEFVEPSRANADLVIAAEEPLVGADGTPAAGLDSVLDAIRRRATAGQGEAGSGRRDVV